MKRKKPKEFSIRLTGKQVEHLHALLDGWMGASSASTILTRRTSQIGLRISKAMGWRWPYSER